MSVHFVLDTNVLPVTIEMIQTGPPCLLHNQEISGVIRYGKNVQ